MNMHVLDLNMVLAGHRFVAIEKPSKGQSMTTNKWSARILQQAGYDPKVTNDVYGTLYAYSKQEDTFYECLPL
jgi:hypothetical protein